MNNGVSWQTIIDTTPNDGSYEWDIPEILATSLAKIRIEDVQYPAIKDESGTFSIESCPIIAGFISQLDGENASQLPLENVTQFCNNTAIQFTNTSINATAYQWQINGNNISTSTHFSNTFNDAGNFEVTLIAFGENNCIDSLSQNIIINNESDAGFYYSIDGLEINFSASESDANSYSWDFGDTTTDSDVASISTPTYTYPVAGNYNVCLEVDGDCEESNNCQNITLIPPNTAIDLDTCKNTTINFTNTSIDADDFEWQVNGVSYATNTNITYTFEEEGLYTVALTAKNEGVCSDVLQKNIWIHNNLSETTLDIGSDKTLCGEDILLTAGIMDMESYLWSLDGEQVGSNSTYLADKTGIYTLQVTDYCGNQQSDEVTILLDDNCVYPGDFNYDGKVNVYDLLPFGLHFGAVGPSRENASLTWIGQPCYDWEGITEEGNNLKHLDGNGNGLIETNDTTAIIQNYGKTHGNPEGNSFESSLVFQLAPVLDDYNNPPNVYTWDLDLSKEGNGKVTAYGIAFSIDYSEFSILNIQNIEIDLENSWLGEENKDMLTVVHHDSNNKIIEIGLTRIDHQNKIGEGSLGALRIEVDDFEIGAPINPAFGIENIQMVENTGRLIPVGIKQTSSTFYPSSCMEETDVVYISQSVLPAFIKGSNTIIIGGFNSNETVSIENGDSLSLQARKQILIEPGTLFKAGSVIDATIGDCSSESSKQDEQETELSEEKLYLKNIPNPFSEQTSIYYYLPEDNPVHLTIYDIHGKIVEQLIQEQEQKKGSYKMNFSPYQMPTGIYLCVLQVGERQETIKFIKSH